MWCPSSLEEGEMDLPTYLEGDCQLRLFPKYHHHTIVHLHWIQTEVNGNSRLNDLQLPQCGPDSASSSASIPSLGLSLPFPSHS